MAETVIENLTSSEEQFDVCIWTGSLAQLNLEHQLQSCKDLILVLPDATQWDALQALLLQEFNQDRVTALSGCLAAESGTSTFYRYNLNVYNGCFNWEGREGIPRNLKCLDQQPVDCFSVDAVLKNRAVDLAGKRVLLRLHGSWSQVLQLDVHPFARLELNLCAEPKVAFSEHACAFWPNRLFLCERNQSRGLLDMQLIYERHEGVEALLQQNQSDRVKAAAQYAKVLQQHEHSNVEWTQRCEALALSRDALQHEMALLQASIDTLKATCDELRADYSLLKNERDSLCGELDKAWVDRDAFSASLKAALSERDALRTEFDVLRDLHLHDRQALSALQAESALIDARFEDLTKESLQLAAHVSALEMENATLSESERVLTERILAQRDAMDALSLQRTVAMIECDGLRAMVAKLESRESTLRDELHRGQAQIDLVRDLLVRDLAGQ